MSDQIVERELMGFLMELQDQDRHQEAEKLGREIDHAKDNLSALLALRDWCDAVLEPQQE